MSIFTQTFTGTLVIETCCKCGIKFGMDQDLYEIKLADKTSFYCPKGHPQHYIGKSEKDELNEQIQRLETRNLNLDSIIQNKIQRIEQLRYSVRAQKAAKTKVLNRIKNGVCPCCNRTFKNLQNHFKTVHPELLEV